MRLSADTPACLRAGVACAFLALSCTFARADELAVSAGPGLLFSRHSSGNFLQYYRDAGATGERNRFLELTAGAWTGEAEDSVVAASAGLREKFDNGGYARLSLGAGMIDRTTGHLGTHGQFMIQLAIGREVGAYDAGVCMIHVSNGDFILHTGKPNDGENFLAFQLGRRF
jgi:Lipid A 3-O-deacylase (PagL)